MTTTNTNTPSAGISARAGRPLGTAGRHVERVIARLMPGGGINSASASALAQLRRGLGREPGTVPEIWPWTMDGLEATASGDQFSAEESAVHHALTLFAYHQQSRPTSMHDPAVGVGAAIRRLADLNRGERVVQETPVYRRFTAMATAADLSEVVTHARGLIGQLRAVGLGLDYARFADDLRWLPFPTSAASVRRRWSRDFYARAAAPDNPAHSESAPEGD